LKAFLVRFAMKGKSDVGIPGYEKMCFLSDSNERHRMEMLKSMARNSIYVCSACGRAASSEEALCSPENIKDMRSFDTSDSEKAYLGDPDLPNYEKMCFLSDSDEEHRMDMLKSMIQDPKYICSACGRIASSLEAICSPEKL
jgi:DNA-directed RNA polymerase subunit RPC12/RpoP